MKSAALKIIAVVMFLQIGLCVAAYAETQDITASGEYVMGENETILTAKKLAFNQALRSASEQAGIFVESYTKTKNYQVSEDEINVLSASIIEVTDKKFDEVKLQGGLKIVCTIKAKVNTANIDLLQSKKTADQAANAREYAKTQQQIKELIESISQLKTDLARSASAEQKQAVARKIAVSEQKAVALSVRQYNLSAQQWYSKAVELDKAGNDNLSVRCLNKAIAIDESYYEAYILKAGIEERSGNPDYVKDYLQALSINPSDNLIWNKVLDNVSPDKQIEYLSKMLDNDPDNITLIKKRLELESSLDLQQQATNDYEHLLKLTDDGSLVLAAGDYQWNCGNYPAAMNYYGRLFAPVQTGEINSGSTAFSNYYARAKALYDKGMYAQALYDCENALACSPGNEDVLLLQAQILYDRDDYYAADVVCDNIIAINPLNAQAYILSVKTKTKTASYDEAVESARNALTLNSSADIDRSVFLKPVLENKKWGYYDVQQNKWKIKPRYSDACYFHDGIGLARDDNGNIMFINADGDNLFSQEFYGAGYFSDGLAMVRKNGLLGYVDKTGKYVIHLPDNCSSAETFSEGLACICIDGKYGYIDETGKLVIPARYDSAVGFSYGLARVKIAGKYGYINRSGKIVIEPQYDDANSFLTKITAVKLNGKYRILHVDGKVANEPLLVYCSVFRRGLLMAARQKEGSSTWEYGYLNDTGAWAINPVYDYAETFYHKKIALVGYQGKKGWIDTAGHWVIDPLFEKAVDFSNGIACVQQNGKAGCINERGQWVIKPVYEATGSSFCCGLLNVKINGKWGYIDETGKMMLQPVYDDANFFDNNSGWARVEVNGRYGAIDKSGRWMLKPEYDGLDYFFSYELIGAAKKVNGKILWGYIDHDGDWVIKPQYDFVNLFINGRGRVYDGKKFYTIDKHGRYIDD